MDIMRRIDQALAITAEAYAKELEAANARLRDSLVEARAQRDYYRLWAKEMALTNGQPAEDWDDLPMRERIHWRRGASAELGIEGR